MHTDFSELFMNCRCWSNPLSGVVFPIWNTLAFRVHPDTPPPPLSLLAAHEYTHTCTDECTYSHMHILTRTRAHTHTHPAPFDSASLARTWPPSLFLGALVESHFIELQKGLNGKVVSRKRGFFHWTSVWPKRGEYKWQHSVAESDKAR